jgi:hypothetical protein
MARRFAERVRRRLPLGPGTRHRRALAQKNGAVVVARSEEEALEIANRFAPSISSSSGVDGSPLARGRSRVRGPLHRAGRRRLRDRIEPRAADLWSRAFQGGLSAADFVR